jgi:hypothetical protein
MITAEEAQALVAVHRDHHVALLDKFEKMRPLFRQDQTEEQKSFCERRFPMGR